MIWITELVKLIRLLICINKKKSNFHSQQRIVQTSNLDKPKWYDTQNFWEGSKKIFNSVFSYQILHDPRIFKKSKNPITSDQIGSRVHFRWPKVPRGLEKLKLCCMKHIAPCKSSMSASPIVVSSLFDSHEPLWCFPRQKVPRSSCLDVQNHRSMIIRKQITPTWRCTDLGFEQTKVQGYLELLRV